mmetsp:Transcript_4340/g.12694  ORF Transcript_4340/g.12694 Transcript_4340/m.12694 type:complete len:275 (-) Transcript_4340:1129-1953(-)
MKTSEDKGDLPKHRSVGALPGCLREGDVRVALVGRAPGGAAALEALHVPDADAGASALRGAQDLGQRAAVRQVLGALLPRHGAICELLRQNGVALLCLQEHVVAALRGASPLHVLHGLDDLLVRLRVLGSLGAGMHREDDANSLLGLVGLRGADLEASDLVDPEPGAILRGLVEDGHGRLQDLVKHAGLGLVVWPRVQHLAGLVRGCLALNAHGVLPRGREERTRLINDEVLAKEVLSPLLPHSALLRQQLAQGQQAGLAAVRRHKGIALLAPV